MLFDAPDEVLGIVKFTEHTDSGCWGGGVSVYGDSVSVLRTACRRCGGHSRSDKCVSSVDSVSPLWWPQPQQWVCQFCRQRVSAVVATAAAMWPLSATELCTEDAQERWYFRYISPQKENNDLISLHIQSGIIFEVSQVWWDSKTSKCCLMVYLWLSLQFCL